MVTHYVDDYGNGVGGGEILNYWSDSGPYSRNMPYMNNELIQQYHLVPIITAIIIFLILFIMVRLIMKVFKIDSFRRSKGMLNELNYANQIRKTEAKIYKLNRRLRRLTSIVEASPFRQNKADKEYLEYNLSRVGLKIPGGSRIIKAEEFNAIRVACVLAIILLGLVITILFNMMLGVVTIVMTIVLGSSLPMMVIRAKVKDKDDEIVANFSDFYLMLHYVLLARAKSPLVSIMQSYSKTTESEEMKNFVDVCSHYMNTYGEYEGTRYISSAYREIAYVGKLMRLIRQNESGGDVEAELIGFREEILNARKYALQKRTDKLIARARASFNLLMPVLFQAILSAMSIYLTDLGVLKTFI